MTLGEIDAWMGAVEQWRRACEEQSAGGPPRDRGR
jgi:hypothetical protein